MAAALAPRKRRHRDDSSAIPAAKRHNASATGVDDDGNDDDAAPIPAGFAEPLRPPGPAEGTGATRAVAGLGGGRRLARSKDGKLTYMTLQNNHTYPRL